MPTYSNNPVLSRMSRNSIVLAPSRPRKRAAEDKAPQVSATSLLCNKAINDLDEYNSRTQWNGKMQKYQMTIVMKRGRRRGTAASSNNRAILPYDSRISTGNGFLKTAKHISINRVGRYFKMVSPNEHLLTLHYLKGMATTIDQMLTFLELIERPQVQVVSVIEAEKYKFS